RRRQTRTPPAALGLRQIHERAILYFESAELLEQLLADDGSKSVSSACGVNQTIALVVSEDERVERLRPDRVAANHKFLPAVDAHFLPGARSQAGLVPAVETLRHQPFKPLCFYRLDKHR